VEHASKGGEGEQHSQKTGTGGDSSENGKVLYKKQQQKEEAIEKGPGAEPVQRRFRWFRCFGPSPKGGGKKVGGQEKWGTLMV